MSDLIAWFANAIVVLWGDILNFTHDFWIGIADSVLSVIAGTLESVPAPGFLGAYSVGNIIAMLPPGILYFVGLLHLNEGFAMIAAAYSFRVGRKIATFFVW